MSTNSGISLAHSTAKVNTTSNIKSVTYLYSNLNFYLPYIFKKYDMAFGNKYINLFNYFITLGY